MKTKRFFALLLGLLMLVSLAACAAPAAESAEGAEYEAETAVEPAVEPAADAVKITYSYWGTPDEAASVQAAVDTFNAAHPEIFVEITCIPNEQYVEKLNTMATAGELPDCGIMSEAGTLDFGSKGLLADVSSMYDGADAMPLDCITFKADGKPVAYSAANEILLLYYNKDMFDAANVAYPDPATPYTWDEFVTVAKQLTLDKNGKNAADPDFDKDNIVQYGCTVDNWTWQLEVWALSNGGSWFSKDGSTVTINSAEAIESVQKVADLYLVDHVSPYRAGLTDDGVQSTICAGNVAMSTGGAWNVGTCLPSARTDIGLNYGVARLPVMKDEVTICTGGPQVVFSQTKHPAEAMEFIKWYIQEENSWDSLIATGIWMPILEKYYKDEELTNKWIDNPNFPAHDEYKAAVVDYAMDKAVSTCWYYTPHTNEFIEYLRSILGPVWTGEATAADAINGGYDQLCNILAGF